MKTITPSANEHAWPRHAVKSVEARKRDLVIRITNWMDDKDEPAYDVECYIGGVYDWNESKIFTLSHGIDDQGKPSGGYTKAQAKKAAIEYAQAQIGRLL